MNSTPTPDEYDQLIEKIDDKADNLADIIEALLKYNRQFLQDLKED